MAFYQMCVFRSWAIFCLPAFLLFGLLQFGVASAAAQSIQPTERSLDIVLLLDASGSMLLTDPDRLREEGAKLFLEFMREGDRLAIVEFSDGARVIRPLAEFKKENVGQFRSDIEQVSDSGLYTDILSAVKEASKIFAADSRKDAAQVVVLMSDGMMEPNPIKGTAEDFTETLINSELLFFKEQKIPIYTLYFSEEADPDLLTQIAFATDGINWFTPTAEKIHESYAELFMALKEPQVVPLSAKGFRIDAGVDEATFYINAEDVKTNVRLVTPSGSTLSYPARMPSIRWFRGQKFDVITVQNPEAGDWKVLGLTSQDGFATILTSLRLIVEWPSAIYPDSLTLLQGRLFEGSKPLDLSQLKENIQYAFQVIATDRVAEPIVREFLVDDGQKGDRVAGDGIYSYGLEFKEPGEYQLRVVAKAPTFERHRVIPFRVRPKFVTLSIDESHADSFIVELSPEVIGLSNLEVGLLAVDSSRRRFQIPLRRDRADRKRYLAQAPENLSPGFYQLQASVSAIAAKGQRIRRESEIIEYIKSSQQEPALIPDDKPVEEVYEELPQQKPPVSRWPYILLITLVHGAAGAAAVAYLKRTHLPLAITVTESEPGPDLSLLLDELESRSQLTQISLDDPILQLEDELSEESFDESYLQDQSSTENDFAAEESPTPAEESSSIAEPFDNIETESSKTDAEEKFLQTEEQSDAQDGQVDKYEEHLRKNVEEAEAEQSTNAPEDKEGPR